MTDLSDSTTEVVEGVMRRLAEMELPSERLNAEFDKLGRELERLIARLAASVEETGTRKRVSRFWR